MKNWTIALAVIVAVGFCGVASAEEVSQNALARMGLSGMQQVSDAQGMQVRGEGYNLNVYVDIYKNIYVNANIRVRIKGNVAEAGATADAVATGRNTSSSTYTDGYAATTPRSSTSSSVSNAIALTGAGRVSYRR